MLLSVAFLNSCQTQENAKLKRQQAITSKAEQINSNPVMLSQDNANELITLYDNYIKDYPEDTMCEYYLFQMHNVYSAMKNCDSALYCLDRIIKEYPNGKNVGAAYFFKGVVLNDVCNNHTMSIEAFNEYIRRYPDNPHAKDAKKMIELDTMQNPIQILNHE